MSFPAKPPISRVLGNYTVTETGCWNFNGYINPEGYGNTWNAATNSPVLVHRVMYEHMVGPIPAGLHIDHLCRNRACCRPSHLEPVPPRVNLCRGVGWAGRNAQATHCVNGHEFDDWNTVYRPEGGRTCRTCRNRRAREYGAALSEEKREKRRESQRASYAANGKPSLGREPHVHGRASSYTNYGCRCTECKAAYSAKKKARRAEQVAA